MSVPQSHAFIRGVAPWGFRTSKSASFSVNRRAISARTLAASRAFLTRLRAAHPRDVPPFVVWFTRSMGITCNKPRMASSMPRLRWDSDAAWWSRVQPLESTEKRTETLTVRELQRSALQVGYIMPSNCF